jgi:hypothetical protein
MHFRQTRISPDKNFRQTRISVRRFLRAGGDVSEHQFPCPPCQKQKEDEEDEEETEQDFRDASGARCDACEAQSASDKGDDEEDQGPFQHGAPPEERFSHYQKNFEENRFLVVGYRRKRSAIPGRGSLIAFSTALRTVATRKGFRRKAA